MEKSSATRMTKQRKLLLDELRGMNSHPTADELHLRVQESLPKISLATVYRNLELLTRQGEIRTIELAGMPRRYDGDVHPHFHMQCIDCGVVVDIDARVLPDIGSILRRTGRYEILEMRLEFDGLCGDCRRQ